MALQLDPLAFAATLGVPYLPGLVNCVKSLLGFSSIDETHRHRLSWIITTFEQILDDELEYEHFHNSSALAKIKHFKYAIYRAEDELDKIFIGRSEKSGQPTQSTYNQVFSDFSSSESMNLESLVIKNSVMSSISHANIENCPASWPRYKKLPAPLKKCFELLSIFPTDFQFEKEYLIHLWMAEDFIRDDTESQKLEEIGSIYLDKLVEKSLLLKPADDPHDFYKIDAELHKLAEFVSCGVCLTIKEGQSITDLASSHLNDSLRHFSLRCENYSQETAKLLAGCEGLRTFLLHIGGRSSNIKVKLFDNQLICFKTLRVLDLSCPSIIEVPDSIGCLKHLRYLDLSNSGIDSLPKMIRKLHSLQILKLYDCIKLRSLPCLEHLRSLKHLFLNKNHYLDSLPQGIGHLTFLETFSCPFVVGTNKGEDIGVLIKMNNLRGSLCISNLENVQKLEEAKKAALIDKKLLRQLNLKWSEEPTQQHRFEEVLEGLQPDSKLEKLKISGYGGQIFPDWVTSDSFENLKKVSLINCNGCKHLPSLWRLPKLESLTISKMDQIEQLNDDFFFHIGSGVVFPSLEMLEVKSMENLRSWVTNDIGQLSFPKLNQLTFKDCPMLEQINVLQLLNSIWCLKIKDCELLIRWMDQQPGWQKKKEEDDGSSIYQRI
ncbi:putative disease resistance protein At3g14460 [Macadamia integrifolia]|uniref:putative disease resistance protein At3g14460 n=1 Tax=Macadamia integrifolia TaxID=60698 RepID=UPI001C4E975B|nr:putative disease resistance protein At3g14460 [Macadamia integrifolia]